MVEFRVLPVSEGDAFLLFDDNQAILVDTGIKKNECLELLQKKDVERLDLVIITHYDNDHIGGLLAIIDSIEVREIWLPDVFGKIHATARETGVNLIKRCLEYEQGRTNYEDSNDNRGFEFEIQFLTDWSIRMKMVENNQSELFRGVFMGFIRINRLERIRDIVDSVYSNDSTKIKWLKYNEYYSHEMINPNLPILGLNCIETKNLRPYINDLEILLALTKINRESLVFKYCSDKVPNILYSGDSAYDFLCDDETIDLKDGSIVTAAHHGSNSNDNTYSRVKGNNLIYIRGYSNKIILSEEYLKLNEKYCIRCSNNQKPHEIILKADKNENYPKWTTARNHCTCIEAN